MASNDDYYKVLGVPPTASHDEIRSAFRKMALKYHPDRNKDPSAETVFKRVNEAYEVLGNPSRRNTYDAERRAQAQGAGYSKGATHEWQHYSGNPEGWHPEDWGYPESWVYPEGWDGPGAGRKFKAKRKQRGKGNTRARGKGRESRGDRDSGAVYCASCGIRNFAGTRFCVSCGNDLYAKAGTAHGERADSKVERIPNYLPQAILTTVCCCPPLGILSVAFAAQVNGKLVVGDIKGAKKAAQYAKSWAWAALGIGLGFWIYAFIELLS